MDSNEVFNPEEPIYYNYPIKEFLVKDRKMFPDTDEYSKIILCAYSINTEGKYPFIQYLFCNNEYELSLPILPIYTAFNDENLLSYSKVFLSGLIQIENFNDFNENIDFDGFYDFEKNLYLFFDLTKCKLNLYDIFANSLSRFILIDEIINHKKFCNISINSSVIQFFIKNSSLNYLYDKNNEIYEIPIVGFVGKSTEEKLNFTYTFGESSKNKSGMFGPYYYFTDFNYAIRQGGWSNNYDPEYSYGKLITDNKNGKYCKGGVVRFALFSGKTKYVENMPNDFIDESDIKKQRLNDPSLNEKFEILTLRISDHDGLWTIKYDSIYLSCIELDDGSIIEDAPIIVVKEYKQQLPLSYHFIDKSKLGDKFEPNNYNYKIV